MTTKLTKKSPANSNLVYLLGGVIGGLAGVFAAKMLIDRAREEEKDNVLSVREGAQIGALLLGLIRAISKLSGK